MNFNYASIGSGSCGNCHYVSYNGSRILVDAGMSGKKIQENASKLSLDIKDIDAIMITHEHTDHIKGAGILSRRFDIPVYATEDTWEAMEEKMGKMAPHNIKTFEKDKIFSVGDMDIVPFRINHDATDPVGFKFTNGQKSICIATDTGHIDRYISDHIRGSKLVVLESNHDEEMVKIGPYPYHLKRRVLSGVGHLSNVDAGRFAAELVKSGTNHILLAHLSHDNNFPALAFETVKGILGESGIEANEDMILNVLKRQEISCMYEI